MVFSLSFLCALEMYRMYRVYTVYCSKINVAEELQVRPQNSSGSEKNVPDPEKLLILFKFSKKKFFLCF
jgi:hypothetical protein